MRQTKYPIHGVMQTALSAMACQNPGKTLAKITNARHTRSCRSTRECVKRTYPPTGKCRDCLLSNTRCAPVTGSTNASDCANSCRGRE